MFPTELEQLGRHLKSSVYFYQNLPERFKINEEVISGLLDLNYFKDTRKVSKTAFGYTYDDNETFDNSVVNILPVEIKQNLITLCMKTTLDRIPG